MIVGLFVECGWRFSFLELDVVGGDVDDEWVEVEELVEWSLGGLVDDVGEVVVGFGNGEVVGNDELDGVGEGIDDGLGIGWEGIVGFGGIESIGCVEESSW